MKPRDNDIEASLELPSEMADAVTSYVRNQDLARGSWDNPRDGAMPEPLWPARDNPALEFLIWKAEQSLAAGMSLTTALTQLAVHAWFEGGIENYDRGRRDASRLRSV